MSVFITGMKMPKSCSDCPMLEGDKMDGLCHAASKWLDDDEHWTWYVYPEGDVDDSKPCNCPLIELPPHGDLIDRDALMKTCGMAIDCYDCPNGEHGWCKLSSDAANICEAIEDAPAIIESEEEDG